MLLDVYICMCFGSPHCNNHTKTFSKLMQKIPDLVVRTRFPHISPYPNSLYKLGKVSFPPEPQVFILSRRRL